MDADGTEGQAQRVQRRGQLINSNLFRTNCSRKEYSIKKAYNPAQKACGCQNQCTPQKPFFRVGHITAPKKSFTPNL